MDCAKVASRHRISAAKSPEGVAQRELELSVIDLVARELLVHPGMSGAVSTKQMRTMLRYKAGIKELSGLSNHIHGAVYMLIREHILEHVQQDIGGSDAEGDSPSTLEAGPATPAVRRRLSMKKSSPPIPRQSPSPRLRGGDVSVSPSRSVPGPRSRRMALVPPLP